MKNEKMEEVNLSKEKHSQEQMRNALAIKISYCLEKMAEGLENQDVFENGASHYVAEVSRKGKRFHMTLCLTPFGDKQFDDFFISRLGKEKWEKFNK